MSDKELISYLSDSAIDKLFVTAFRETRSIFRVTVTSHMVGKSPKPRVPEDGSSFAVEIPVHAVALRQEVLLPLQPRQLQDCQ